MRHFAIMNKLFLCFSLSFLAITFHTATAQDWTVLAEDVITFSSPRPADLNGDGTADIVIGGGVDGVATAYGVTAINGITGDTLWTVPASSEIFASAVFQDITGDNVPDVFIGGRNAQFYAINGSTGEIIWDIHSNMTSPFPSEPKQLCFFQGQWIPDQDNDAKEDLVLAYGGDNSAPEWETNRPAGLLLVVSSASGAILGSATVPDGKETYMSPVVTDLENDGTLEVIYGTGGETIGGGLFVAAIQDILNADLPANKILLSNASKGFIAPPAVADFTGDGFKDLAVQGYDGTVYLIDGFQKTVKWELAFPGTESAASPVIGNFTGDITPDIFLTLAKGVAPAYYDFYQVMLDGKDGNLVLKDSIGEMVFPAPVAFDKNGDGRDEILLSYNFKEDNLWRHQFMFYDFQNNDKAPLLTISEPGINVISTPLIADLDGDNQLDLVYSVRKDEQNPGAPNGFYVKRMELSSTVPPVGIASGSYLGTSFNGHYTYTGSPCVGVNLISSATAYNTSCNSVDDGKIMVSVAGGTAPYTYLWSNGSIQRDLLNVADGIYSLRVTDANGCTSDTSRTIKDRYIITKNATHNNCPDGSSGSAAISSSGCGCMTSNCTYAWSNGGTASSISGLTSGTYQITVTHGDGCKHYDSIVVGPQAFELQTSYVPESTAGNDGIAIVKVSGGTAPYSFQWDDPFAQTDDSATGLSSDTYTVLVTDNNSCTASTSVQVVTGSKNKVTLDFNLFPNPSSGEILFRLPANSGITTYRIITVQGELIAEGIFKGASGKINNLPIGMYMIHLRSDEGTSTQKVIIR